MTQKFKFTEKQIEARREIGNYPYYLLYGGSRSAKTFLAVYANIIRALKANASRHAILRFRFNAVKASIIYDTFPKVMKLCFSNVRYNLSKTDWIVSFDNKSEIWFGGLDDKERTEKVLGQEYATIFLNECSQIPYASVGIVETRLAQNCQQNDGVPLRLRMLYDCNPPKKSHWTYKRFIQKVDPYTGKPLLDSEMYGSIRMNPIDNKENLPNDYIRSLDRMPPHLRKRFYLGEFGDVNPNAIFHEEWLDQWRVENTSDLPELVRVVVAVDPSGADDDNNESNDPIGIYVSGLGVDGNAYLMEDATVKAGPDVWGKMAVSAYQRNDADVIVGEQNFGGAMVKFVIKSADRDANYKIVNASRGKTQRAEPFAQLFKDGRARIVGRQPEMEEELGDFSTHGYTGAKSPNRADAAIWTLTELFPGITGIKKEKPKPKPNTAYRHPYAGRKRA